MINTHPLTKLRPTSLELNSVELKLIAHESRPVEHKGSYVRFKVFTAVTMKNAVFWDVTPCGSCKN
jgi:hypothetical protein